MKTNINTYFERFHAQLMGFDCWRNGKIVDKYVLFWSGYSSFEILLGRTDVIAMEK